MVILYFKKVTLSYYESYELSIYYSQGEATKIVKFLFRTVLAQFFGPAST